MSTEKDGGIAFPSVSVHDENRGMTLRDYFAAKALQGMLSALDASGLNYSNPEMMAEHAFVFADKMIAERAK